jgi:phosphoribosylformylglycinamidine cyclo-ligase
MPVGEELLSPTRIFTPIVNKVLHKIKDDVHGMVHNTGGGQTKCLSLGKNIKYVKNALFDPDPIFVLIQREAQVNHKEMYEDFNMGIGFEFIVDPNSVEEVIRIAEDFKIEAQVIGHCESGKNGNSLVLESKHGTFVYY